jgi:iron complex transport system permease protein
MKRYGMRLIVFILLLLLLISCILYLSWGSFQVTPLEIIKTLFGEGTRLQNAAILNLRLPRMLVGISVGIALSTAGALLQTVTKNELADSGIIGINAGAAVAAILFVSSVTSNYYSALGALAIYALPLMAIVGAAFSAGCVYLLSSRNTVRPKRLLLMGLGINAGLNAFITFFIFRGGVGDYNRVLIWTSGSLWGAGWSYVRIIWPLVAGVLLLVLLDNKKLDVLNLTDGHAVSLGLNLEKERRKFLSYAVILAGGATAFAGNVGFIGLISPNIAKKLVGPFHKKFLLVSAMISTLIILFSDAVSRNLFSPVEVPVGITISIFGVPYFIYLMMREK